jgi:prophage DNA circulation protein
MARDWLSAFRPASFRGAAFKVDVEEASGARRLSVSPIAYSDTNVIEDMGGEPRTFRITAYCAGDAADAQAMALVAALSVQGAGLLVLPMLPPAPARVLGWRLRREKDFAGHVAVDIDLIEEGMGAAPFGLGGIVSLVSGLMGKMAAPLSKAFG